MHHFCLAASSSSLRVQRLEPLKVQGLMGVGAESRKPQSLKAQFRV